MSGEVPKGGTPKKKNAWVRAIRGERTQEEFAALLGVGRAMVAKWESGENDPSHENTLKLQRLKERESQTPVLPSVSSRTTEDQMEQELLRLFRGLAPLDKAQLLVDLAKGTRSSQSPAAPSKA